MEIDTMEKALLRINNLVTEFQIKRKAFPVINGVSLSVDRGEILGIVGESGSGKTITSLSVMRLLPRGGRVASGEILFEDRNLLLFDQEEMCNIRGKQISMIFQDPMSALDPVFRCGTQIAETICFHEKTSLKAALDKGVDLLKLVEIPDPERYLNVYPHELSGGMCQRIMIAIALSCKPKLLIADEPTTALDVTVQARILDILRNIREELGTSIMLITHDLGVVVEIADRVAVMYAGEVVEEGDVKSLFNDPRHPYTKGLMKSVPRLDQGEDRLYSIEGTVPGLDSMPAGCRFWPRCLDAADICHQEKPAMVQVSDSHRVCCWKLEKAGVTQR
jgi:oligopeptide/dipeptide ABC transporter ATP-binding protein